MTACFKTFYKCGVNNEGREEQKENVFILAKKIMKYNLFKVY